MFSLVSSVIRTGIHQSCHTARLSDASRALRLFSTGMATNKSLDIRGVYPPIVTPFTKEEDVDYDKLQENMEKWNKISFRGYVVQGSNGECAYLTIEEKLKVLKKVKECAGDDKLIIAGSGLETTRHTIQLTEEMAEAGADAALVVTPCYYKGSMTNPALLSHFTKVADASPIPVILYSVPGNTAIDLAPDVIIELSRHPNIIGLKDSGGDIAKLANIVYRTKGNDFQVLAGSASFLYPALAAGCVGGVCALSNVLGAATVELQALAEAGRHPEAAALQQRLVAPNAGVTKQFGVAGLKQALDWFGYYGGPCRSPLQPLGRPQQDTLRQIFSDTGFMEGAASE